MKEKTTDRYRVEYRLDSGADHPKSYFKMSEKELYEVAERAHQDYYEHRAEGGCPKVGKGLPLIVAYDSETATDSGAEYMRVMSYQLYLVCPGGEFSAIYYPHNQEREGRLQLHEILWDSMRYAMDLGLVLQVPRQVVFLGFFLRYDLALLDDLYQFKTKLSNINGKACSGRRPIELPSDFKVNDPRDISASTGVPFSHAGVSYIVPVKMLDIATHAEPKISLERIGNMLGIYKREVAHPYSKGRMDEYMNACPKEFGEYGHVDVKIVAKYYLEIINFIKENIDEEFVDDCFIPVSAGALSTKWAIKTMLDKGLDYMHEFGLEEIVQKDYSRANGVCRTKRKKVKTGHREFHEGFASRCYAGGRNETGIVGANKVPGIRDFDLSGAYSNGMAILRSIDYDNSYETKNVDDFKIDTVGFAWVDFTFKDHVRFPCLPVRIGDQGLIFPMAGRSYCTAPEIALSVSLGVEDLTIRRGVIYPVINDAPRIFLDFVRAARKTRKRYPKGSVFEQYAKLLANSVYGKTGQGLKGKRVFNFEALDTVFVPESPITNAPMAAFITGFVRAVMGEILNGVPAYRNVYSCTTDGILTDAEFGELDLNGPLCQMFEGLCELVEAENE